MTVSCLDIARQASFVLISDGLAQSGRLLFEHLVWTTAADARDGPICLVTVQDEARSYFPAAGSGAGKTGKVQDVNLFSNGYSSTIDLNNVFEKVQEMKAQSVFIDSISMLALLTSPHAVVSFMRKVLNTSARLVTILSNDIPTNSDSADLQYLLQPHSLSTKSITLCLHHPNLLESLRDTYNIPLDLSGEGKHDLRIYDFLARFSAKGWAGHGMRADEIDEYEENATFDPLGNAQVGRCILEWQCSDVLAKSGANQKMQPRRAGKSENFPTRGIIGLRLVDTQSKALEFVQLSEVLEARSNIRPNYVDQDPLTNITSGLPFNLSLSDEQRKAKDKVILPFAMRQDGQAGSGGAIIYEPDSNDDIDEEEDDEI